jgi:hypothetical protein
MYLIMTEQDYQDVRREARLQTARAIGIPDESDATDCDLDASINRVDHVTHERFCECMSMVRAFHAGYASEIQAFLDGAVGIAESQSTVTY